MPPLLRFPSVSAGMLQLPRLAARPLRSAGEMLTTISCGHTPLFRMAGDTHMSGLQIPASDDLREVRFWQLAHTVKGVEAQFKRFVFSRYFQSRPIENSNFSITPCESAWARLEGMSHFGGKASKPAKVSLYSQPISP